MAAIPVNELNVHHQARLNGLAAGILQGVGLMSAVEALDGARVVTVKVAAAEALLLKLTEDGETEHVAPGTLALKQAS